MPQVLQEDQVPGTFLEQVVGIDPVLEVDHLVDPRIDHPVEEEEELRLYLVAQEAGMTCFLLPDLFAAYLQIHHPEEEEEVRILQHFQVVVEPESHHHHHRVVVVVQNLRRYSLREVGAVRNLRRFLAVVVL